MIASVNGTVARAGLDHAVVEVGGVGLLVRLTPGTASGLRPGEQAHLATSLVIREDAWTLYGFADDTEREIFEVAQSVTGVGPRMAQAMLAVFTPARLRSAIAGGEIATLVKVPGIGKKSAERIVLELKDKMLALTLASDDIDDPGIDAAETATDGDAAPWRAPVVEALVSLGWSVKQAEGGADAVLAEVGANAEVGVALKAALKELGR
ncbi:MAG: Holliday junction branch migration protein RuvA [Dermatophilus congolensis]|nr:Holliday junction branch migration protein RuvA [Dermatophilus congolensis]